jgi:hypothetical protein
MVVVNKEHERTTPHVFILLRPERDSKKNYLDLNP